MFGNGNGNGKGLSNLYDSAQGTERLVDDSLKDTVANEVIDQALGSLRTIV